jgi:glycosyltransferase involved in cell wall biosynthesis
MKIAVDGFALGFAQGTGITRYAFELSKALAERHQVSLVYGLDRVGRIPDLQWPRFIQSLMVRGEAGPSDIWRWGPYSARYLVNYLLGHPIRAKQVPVDARIDASALAGRLPPVAKLYNVPLVYRSAQAYSYLFGHPLRLALDDQVDIWHLTLPMPIKVAGAKCVVTAHDIIPIVLPHSTGLNLRHYRRMIWNSFRSADMIFADSEHTKRDLLSHFNLPEHKIFVTYLSVDIPQEVMAAKDDAIAGFLRKAFGLNYREYFLFYGAIQPRKNLQRIIEAICAAKTRMPIVIAGGRGWLDHDVQAIIERARGHAAGRRNIIRLEHLPYPQLMHLLKGARGLVFPSLYEGFGIPVLEAMLMGCPVITSKSSSLPEVGGDAVLYADPLDVSDIARAIDALAADDELCAKLIERGRKQAARFSKERHVAKLEEGYRLAREA